MLDSSYSLSMLGDSAHNKLHGIWKQAKQKGNYPTAARHWNAPAENTEKHVPRDASDSQVISIVTATTTGKTLLESSSFS